jgi:hypothetical protein
VTVAGAPMHYSAKREVVLRVDRTDKKDVWCLTLGCGHELWITSKSEPFAKSKPCPTCKEKKT